MTVHPAIACFYLFLFCKKKNGQTKALLAAQKRYICASRGFVMQNHLQHTSVSVSEMYVLILFVKCV